MGDIKVASFNCCSLVGVGRAELLEQSLKDNDVAVCMLQETWLKKEHTTKFVNYRLYRTDRARGERGASGRARGGTAIAVRKDVVAQVVPLSQLVGLSVLEATAVVIKLSNGRRLFCISLYNADSNRRVTNDLYGVFEKLCLDRPENEYIVGGDFNAAHVMWGYNASRPRGWEMVDFAEQTRPAYGCRILASVAPSREIRGSGTWPDLFLVKDTADLRPIADDAVNALSSVVVGFSDHKMVLLSCNGWSWESSESTAAEGRFGRLRRGVRTINKEQFCLSMHENCGLYGLDIDSVNALAERSLDEEELNRLTESFTELVVDSMELSMPERRQRTTPYVPRVIRDLTEEKK